MPRIYSHTDYVGFRFGRLLVVEEAGRKLIKQGKKSSRLDILWLCRCDCGKESKVVSSALKNTQSCGCLKLENQRRALIKPTKEVAATLQFNIYKRNADEKNRSWHLTKEEVGSIVFLPCNYCGSLPANKLFNSKHKFIALVNGIDRLDSSQGYEKDNVVPCCWICNKAKGAATYEEFMNWIHRLTEFQSQRNVT